MITVSGILKDPMNNVAGNVSIKVITKSGFADTLTGSIAEYATNSDGSYSFPLVTGSHIISVKFDVKYITLGLTIINEETPSVLTLSSLLNYTSPLTPNEVAKVIALTKQATEAASLSVSAKESAESFANLSSASSAIAVNSVDSISALSTAAVNAASSALLSKTDSENFASESNASKVISVEAAAEAKASEVAVALIFDQFDDRYLGSKSSDPTTDNDGDTLIAGTVYFNTIQKEVKFYNGESWDSPSASATSSAIAALESESKAKLSEDETKLSAASSEASSLIASAKSAIATDASTASLQSANDSASSASASALSEVGSGNSEAAALASEVKSKQSEVKALESENKSKESEVNALASENKAKLSETNSSLSEQSAAEQAVIAASHGENAFSDGGSIELSEGTFPAKPATATLWVISTGGVVDGVMYVEGETLAYSKQADIFFRLKTVSGAVWGAVSGNVNDQADLISLVSAVESNAALDASTKANSAESNSKNYTDTVKQSLIDNELLSKADVTALDTQISNEATRSDAYVDEREIVILGTTAVNSGKLDNIDSTGFQQIPVANIPAPLGGYLSTTTTSVGCIKVKLPQSWVNGMISFTISGYNYGFDAQIQIRVSAFIRESGLWDKPVVDRIVGASPLQVRLGHDGDTCCVYVGSDTAQWSYTQVAVTDFVCGYEATDPLLWSTGWSISAEAIAENVNYDTMVTDPESNAKAYADVVKQSLIDVEIAAKADTDTVNSQIGAEATRADAYIDTRETAILSATALDATSKADTAESNAKTYADSLSSSDVSDGSAIYVDGVLTQFTEVVGGANKVTDYTYTDGVLTQSVEVYNGITRTTTYTYTDGVFTGFGVVVS